MAWLICMLGHLRQDMTRKYRLTSAFVSLCLTGVFSFTPARRLSVETHSCVFAQHFSYGCAFRATLEHHEAARSAKYIVDPIDHFKGYDQDPEESCDPDVERGWEGDDLGESLFRSLKHGFEQCVPGETDVRCPCGKEIDGVYVPVERTRGP